MALTKQIGWLNLCAIGLLVAALLWSLNWARTEKRSRLAAEHKVQVAESVNRYISDAFGSASSVVAAGEQPKIVRVLDSAVARLEQSAPADVEAELLLRQWLARSYRSLELFDPAIEQISRVRALHVALHGSGSAQAVDWDIALAAIQIDRGRLNAAGDLLRPLVQRENLAEAQQLGVLAQLARGSLVTGDPTRAAAELRPLLPRANVLAEEPPQTLWQILQVLAIAEIQLGQFEQARGHLASLVQSKSDHYGPEHGEVLRNRGDLAIALDSLGRWDEAAAILRDVHAKATELYGPTHIETVTTLQKLAKILIERDQSEEGIALLEQIAPVITSARGDDHPQVLAVRSLRAAADDNVGNLAAAESEYRKLVAVYERSESAKSPEALIARNNLASILVKRGDPEQARALLYLIQRDARQSVGEQHYLWGIIASNYGDALTKAGRAKGAIAVLERSIEVLAQSLGADHERVITATERLQVARKAALRSD